jgi:hypothetical protein
MNRRDCANHSPWVSAEHVFWISPESHTSDCCDRPRNNIFLIPGTGFNIDLNNVAEGTVSIELARLAISCALLRRALVKIDFSTIIEVEDGNEVELLIALKRTCNGYSTVLETYELEFDAVESLPFSFTFTDSDICCRYGCCIYTVEIVRIDVEGGTRVNEIETESTAINAIVQRY